MGVKREYIALLLFCAILAVLPVWGGRTANGTSDYLQDSMTTKGIFTSNISAGSQPQGTVSFFLNLISFPVASGSVLTCTTNCAEIVNVIAGHWAGAACATTIGACLDILVCANGTTFCTAGSSGSIFVDITTPNVGEADAQWPISTGLHQYVFLLNRTYTSMAMYRDGSLVTIGSGGQSGDPGPVNYAGTGGGCGSGACALTVLAAQGSSAQSFAHATISDLAFWNVTLSAGEIKSLANCVPPNRIEPEHVSYWPMYGVDSPEPDYSAFFTTTLLPLTLHGTTKTLQQVGCQPGGAHH